jgi:hypothetical protein
MPIIHANDAFEVAAVVRKSFQVQSKEKTPMFLVYLCQASLEGKHQCRVLHNNQGILNRMYAKKSRILKWLCNMTRTFSLKNILQYTAEN